MLGRKSDSNADSAGVEKKVFCKRDSTQQTERLRWRTRMVRRTCGRYARACVPESRSACLSRPHIICVPGAGGVVTLSLCGGEQRDGNIKLQCDRVVHYSILLYTRIIRIMVTCCRWSERTQFAVFDGTVVCLNRIRGAHAASAKCACDSAQMMGKYIASSFAYARERSLLSLGSGSHIVWPKTTTTKSTQSIARTKDKVVVLSTVSK